MKHGVNSVICPGLPLAILSESFVSSGAVLNDAAASITAGDITITATSSGNISAGVFGVEYGIGRAAGYVSSVNVAGAASSQSITIGAGQGIAANDIVNVRAYYNFDPLDGVSTRVYGSAITPDLGTRGAPTGTATSGQTLTVAASTEVAAAGASAMTISYQWVRGASTDIGGATSSTYVLTDTDVGSTIKVRVRETNSAGYAEVTSTASAVVASNLQSKVGSFTSAAGTGNQSVTGVGFQPKVVIFFGAGASAVDMTQVFGVAVSSSQRWVAAAYADDAASPMDANRLFLSDACLATVTAAAAIDRRADFVSMDADGFTVNWSVASAATIYYLALGGNNLQVKAGNIDIATSGASQSVSSIGFTPTAVIFGNGIANTTEGGIASASMSVGAAVSSSSRWASGVFDLDATDPSASRSGLVTSAAMIRASTDPFSLVADLTSLNSGGGGGFTLNVTTFPAATQRWGYLALGGVSVATGTTAQRTSNGTTTITGLSFQPVAELFVTDGKATHTDASVAGRLGIGAVDSALNQAVHYGSTQTAVTPSNTSRYISATKALASSADGGVTANAEAAVSAQNSDGFTINWTTTDATARVYGWLAIGP